MAARKSVNPEELHQLFQSKVHEYTVHPKGDDGWTSRAFVLTAKLRKWLNSTAGKTNDLEGIQSPKTTNAELLLKAAYEGSARWNSPYWPIAIQTVVEQGSTGCIFTLCILLELRLGDLMHIFRRCSIVDSELPLPLIVLQERIFKALRESPVPDRNPNDLARDFDNLQWKYFAGELRYQDEWPIRGALPFVQRKLITGKGATARVYEVAVPEQFVNRQLKNVSLKLQGLPDIDFKNVGPVYHFAVKVFIENKALYEQEVAAYKTLGRNEGMVKYLGNFSHKVDDKVTHNILLEYAENDLAEYFLRTPPMLSKHIDEFWNNLMGIMSAIEQLHNFEWTRTSGDSIRYQGWHADIKSDNILLVQGAFKLADPGFARFQKQQDADRANSSTSATPLGTFTYNAPERCQRNRGRVDHTKSDLWSFGCVLSEAATWVVLGRAGIKQYSMLRQEALAKATFNHNIISESTAARLKIGDSFHDGVSVLPIVTEWHRFLRRMSRPTDKLTANVLDLVDNSLFVARPDQRSNANVVSTRWQDYRKKLSKDMPPVIDAIERVLSETAELEANELREELLWRGAEIRREMKQSASLLPFAYQSRTTIPNPDRPAQAENRIEWRPLTVVDEGNAIGMPNSSNMSPDHIALTSHSTSRRDSFVSKEATDKSEDKKGAKFTMFDAFYHPQDEESKLPKSIRWITRKEYKKKDQKLNKEIVDRDLLFLVDNGATMAEFWSEATFLLDILVRKTWNIDPNGLELKFTCGPVKVECRGKHQTDDLKAVMAAMNSPDARPDDNRTNMAASLKGHLANWLNGFRISWKGQRPWMKLTIIVLTDGQWRGMNDNFGVDTVIKEYHEDLVKAVGGQKTLPERPVSIQFLSFGNDADALDRLHRLDNDLGWEGVPDIVDTEPSNGDIYQMLLGSITDDHDSRNDKFHARVGSLTMSEADKSPSIGPLSPVTSTQMEARMMSSVSP